MIRAEYYSKLDEVEVKCNLSVQKLKAELEKKYQNIFDATANFILDYNKHIKDRKHEHKVLKDQEDYMQDLIDQQFKQLKNGNSQIKKLREQFNDLKQSEGNKVLDLEAEMQYFSNTFLSLKNKLEIDSQHDFNQLVRLSDTSNFTFCYLEKLIKKGETLLKIAAICRKLETQKEKIMPFPLDNRGLSPGADKTRPDRDDYKDELIHVKKELTLFWQRVGQASGIKFAINREKQFLQGENDIFFEAYEDYCHEKKYPEIKPFATKIGQCKIDAIDAMRSYNIFRKGAL